MQKFLLSTFFLFISCASNLNSNPDEIEIITSDLDRFWDTVDNYEGDLSVALEENYIKPGTEGLKDFIPKRIISSSFLASTYLEDKDYYTNIRMSTMQVDSTKKEIIKYCKLFKKIYPKAKFPDIYYVIGSRNSGGTASRNGLLIGAETFKNFNESIPTVIHELMHFNQSVISFPMGSSLNQAIHEGGADFVAGLVFGDSLRMNNETYEYGYKNEKALWMEFKSKMHETGEVGSQEIYKWFYGGQEDGFPMMLGYFIGHQITKSYYDKKEDKQAAVKRILNHKLSNKFLIDSGYQVNEDIKNVSWKNAWKDDKKQIMFFSIFVIATIITSPSI